MHSRLSRTELGVWSAVSFVAVPLAMRLPAVAQQGPTVVIMLVNFGLTLPGRAPVRLGVLSTWLAVSLPQVLRGYTALREVRPEILLLDIAMPVLDGFAMLERLEPETTPPAVIFVTAYDEHAVRAFEAEALDFLVKPVSDARLASALQRAVRRIAEARSLRASLEPASEVSADDRYLRQIVIPERGRQLLIPVADVEWIEADTYYVRIHSCGRIRLLRERLAKLEASLDPDLFVRTHRSALARRDLIREIRAQSPYSYTAVLTTGARVPVSRERLKRVTASLVR